jgi:hypothetical protein
VFMPRFITVLPYYRTLHQMKFLCLNIWTVGLQSPGVYTWLFFFFFSLPSFLPSQLPFPLSPYFVWSFLFPFFTSSFVPSFPSSFRFSCISVYFCPSLHPFLLYLFLIILRIPNWVQQTT